MKKIQLSFTDTDTDANQVGGDVLLKLNGAPQPKGFDQYVLYWGGSAGSAAKGEKIAEVSVDIDGDLLYQIKQDTAIPASKNRYFLLFLQKLNGDEIYSGISTKVTDETQTAEEKAEAARIAEENRLAEVKAEAARVEEEKRQEEVRLERIAEEKRAAEVAQIAQIVVENVLFDFDRSRLKSEYKQKLNDSFADVENRDELKVIISGHADERGSNEYNLALGERRAFAVKRYLISLGLLEENISVISYGEEKPVDPRHSESAWAKNRRSETDMRD